FKDDVKEVASGYECGVTLEKYRDIKEGDEIEAYEWSKSNPNKGGDIRWENYEYEKSRNLLNRKYRRCS
ncbi:MAG: hypothetical protein ACLUQN_06210, partial [Megasphaera sp.]